MRTFKVLLLLLVLPVSAAANSMRCDDRVIRTGDRAWELERACGSPDVIETLRAVIAPDGGIVATRELWVYNFGPQRLIREVEIEDGRIVAIHRARHGYRSFPGGPCSPTEIRRGMSRVELLAKCGEPDYRNRLPPRVVGRDSTPGGVVGPAREEWVYEFAPGGLPRVVMLEGGTVVNVELGSRR